MCILRKQMKILRKNEGLLSNFEVCELLKQRELKRHEQGEHEVDEEEEDVDFDEEFEPLYPTPRAPCETEIRVLKEFKEEGMRVGKDERQSLQKFIETIKGMELTKAETLMLINLKPRGKRKRAFVKAIIESCDERMNEDEVDDLLSLVKTYLV